MDFISNGNTAVSNTPETELVTPLTIYMTQTKPPWSRPTVRRRLPSHSDLDEACAANDIRRVREIFADECLDGDYATWCMLDVESLDTMRCLLEHGADASRYMSGSSPKSLDAVKLCVEFGYDVKAEGHKLLQDFSHDREGLFWLLDHGADINRTDEDRRDSDFYRRLHDHQDYSLKHLNRIAGRGDIQSFNDLVSRGANPHLSIALHRASKCQDAATCVVMIDNLLDTHHMDIEADNELFRNRMDFSPDSGTPLNCALYYQNIAAIKHLLKRGANPESAVSHAIGTDYFHGEFLPALGPLLDAGADPDDALELAATRDDIEAAAICLSRGANPRPIIESQEARTARKALKRQLGTLENNDDPDHMDDHMDERDWSKEMETFLKFVDAHR